MRKFRTAALAAGTAILLSGCLVMQGFALLDGSVAPGGKTKVRFTLRPYSTNPTNSYQFILVGVPDTAGLTAAKATWGSNGVFGGPYKMSASTGLPDAMKTNGGCTANGLAYSSITGITWRAYITRDPVNTQGRVDREVLVDVAVRVGATATSDTSPSIMGVTGTWADDGDGMVNAADQFFCTGISSISLYVE